MVAQFGVIGGTASSPMVGAHQQNAIPRQQMPAPQFAAPDPEARLACLVDPEASDHVKNLSATFNENSAQHRKVFIGGVPQDVNQNDLYNKFQEFGNVKKAWLQRHRGKGESEANPAQHRGFGFVIFHEASGVDNLLGRVDQKFLTINDNRRIEVKRAISSNVMGRSDVVEQNAKAQQNGNKVTAKGAGKKKALNGSQSGVPLVPGPQGVGRILDQDANNAPKIVEK